MIEENNSYMNPISIKSIALNLKDCSMSFSNSCKNVVRILDMMSQIVSADDRSFGNAINGLIEKYNSLMMKSTNQVDNMTYKMNSWADECICNQEETANKINNINNDLNKIEDLISKLN